VKISSIDSILKFASFRNKYDLLSNNVARNIFEAIKLKISNRFSFKDSFYEKGDEEYTIDYLVKFVDKDDIKADIKAKFYYPDNKTEPYIDIKIYIGLNFSEQDLERLYWQLYESIRHEYEHFDKYSKGFWPDEEYNKTVASLDSLNLQDIDKVNLISKYILDPIEIDSYAKSTVYVAKKRKTPYGNVIDDILDRSLFGNNENIKKRMLENQEICRIISDIKDKLVERVKKLFPAIVLKDSF